MQVSSQLWLCWLPVPRVIAGRLTSVFQPAAKDVNAMHLVLCRGAPGSPADICHKAFWETADVQTLTCRFDAESLAVPGRPLARRLLLHHHAPGLALHIL